MEFTVEPTGSIVAVPGDSHKSGTALKGETSITPGNMITAVADNIDAVIRQQPLTQPNNFRQVSLFL